MHNNRSPVLILVLILAILTLVACVRPYPQEESAQEQSADVTATQPFLPPEDLQQTPVVSPLPIETADPLLPTVEILPTQEVFTDTIHTVGAGDTLFGIASQYGVSIDLILAANDIPDINALEVGTQLVIPAPGSVLPTSTPEVVAAETPVIPVEPTAIPVQPNDGTHVVQAGENLYRIGLQYGCSVEQMSTANGITNVNILSVGQILQIPDC